MAKSSSWSVILTTAVPDGASTEVPTPGLDLAAINPESVQLAVDNDVVPMPDKATVDYGDGSKATITNATGEEWPSGVTVYLYVEAAGVGEDLEATVAGMQADITANASAISALQSAVTDLQARVAVLEAAAPPATMSASKK